VLVCQCNSRDSVRVSVSVRAETVLVCQCKSRDMLVCQCKSRDSASVSV
jgi:hypothetical protein